MCIRDRYRSRGYNFDITNSTAFDQAFVKGRNIFDSVSAIVDEVIGQYLQKPFYREPYYAEYCDGKIATCPGLKQWGTLDLANRGYDSKMCIRDRWILYQTFLTFLKIPYQIFLLTLKMMFS